MCAAASPNPTLAQVTDTHLFRRDEETWRTKGRDVRLNDARARYDNRGGAVRLLEAMLRAGTRFGFRHG